MAIYKDFKYDVLVYNNAFTGVISTLKHKAKVIVMINDYNRLSFLEENFSFSRNYFKNFLLFHFEKVAAKNAKCTIVNSVYLKQTISKMYGLSEDKIKVLYKGVDLKEIKFRLREDFGSTIHILFVKGGYVNGGYYDLIKAIKEIKDYNIKITIIGPRVVDLGKIKNHLLDNNINFTLLGPTHPDEVKKYFEMADIFCVPSYKEALGVANIQALASGLPVISTNVGGIPEVLDYGRCGWMVKPGKPKELAVAIKECIQNHKLRIKRSKAGYEHVKKFDSNNLINNFLDIINSVN